MKIEKMLPEQIEEILQIEKESFSDAWTYEMFLSALKEPFYFATVLENEKIIGYGGILTASGSADIVNVCVKKEYRKQGYGRLIVRHLLDYAKSNKTGEVFLEARQSNISAIRLYSSFGFLKIAVRKHYYNHPVEDAVIMKLYLKENTDE